MFGGELLRAARVQDSMAGCVLNLLFPKGWFLTCLHSSGHIFQTTSWIASIKNFNLDSSSFPCLPKYFVAVIGRRRPDAKLLKYWNDCLSIPLASKLLKPSWHLEYVFTLLLALEWHQILSEM